MISPNISIGITEEEQMEFFRSVRFPRFLQIRKLPATPMWTMPITCGRLKKRLSTRS